MKRQPLRANKSTSAEVMGVTPATLTNYCREPGFPTALNGEFELREVVLWWLQRKAPQPLREQVHGDLANGLGYSAIAEEDKPRSAKEKMELLDLALKEAKLKAHLSNLIAVDDVRTLFESFGASMADALAKVEQTTGQPVADLIRTPFDELYEALDAFQRSKGRAK